MTTLRFAPGLNLPTDAVTQRLAFLGRIGSGKTYAATKLAELMLDAGAQVVALDPVGLWYGLRVPGTGTGYPLPVFGGLHGDLPLEASGGALMADIIVDRALSCVVDVSQFPSDAQKARFASDFGERFFARQKAAPSAVHIFLEECQEFIPQHPQRDEAMMLHHWTRLAKLGRNYGIGLSLISQRPQEVNKKVLNLTECMVALQMRGKQERDTMKDWATTQDADVSIVQQLPHLAVGEAIVDSPQWLRVSGSNVKAYPKRTADVSATPQVGAERTESKPLTKVDLDTLREQMAATVEKVKADDPKHLQKRIAELERELKAAPARISGKTVVDTRAVERAAADAKRQLAAQITNLRKALEAAMKFIINVSTQNFDVAGVDKAELERAITAAVGKATQIIDQRLSAREKSIEQLRQQATAIVAKLNAALGDEEVVLQVDVARNEPFTVSAPPRPATPRPPPSPRVLAEGVTTGQQKILNALAELRAIGINEPRRQQLSLFASMSLNGGSGAQNVADLVAQGLVEIPDKGIVRLTSAGVAAASAGDTPSSLDELHARVMGKLTTGQQKILAHLLELYPKEIARSELSEAVAMSLNGGSGAQNVADLVTLGTVRIPRPGKVVASELMFPEGLS